MTPIESRLLEEFKASGVPARDISRILRRIYDNVREWIKIADMPSNRLCSSEEDKRIKELRNAGLSLRAISRETGRAPTTVIRRLRNMGE